ncbi:hypothetical protein Q3G72_035180 [Acer saccharum]|nr:hypothetical protein Q3G72_035180 [Acer saccharum]
MTSIWRVSGGVEIEWVEGNLFAFHFKNMEDRKRILTGGPWNFDRAMIIFDEPVGDRDVQSEVSEIDLEAGKEGKDRFIRVRVMIATAEPLKRSITVDLMGTGKITTMLLRYE